MITRLIRHYIISDELPLEGRLFNIITCIGLFGAFVAAIMTVVFAGLTVGSMLIVVLAVGLLMLILAANKTGNYQMASMLICLGVCCCLYPLIFFTTGGILSGMPCWFILGIVIIFAMLRGAKMVIALTLTIITQIICAIIEYYYPEIVFRYQPYSFPQFEDVVQAYLIVGMVVGLTIKLQLNVYEKEKKKADAASEAKAEFLANMSHEIRTPLNAILGMNEMIVRESESKEIQEYALNVENAGKTLLSLINDVLDMSRIEAGCMDLVAVEYRLNTLIQDSLNLIKERMQEKNLILKLQINPNIPDILYGDEVRIRQILTNLLTNAVKYTERGSVTLIMDYRKLTKSVLPSTDFPGAETQIELFIAVEDTGCGIREEDISHLFDSFNRVNERNNRHIEGTGLGLSITKRLVEKMQGTIGVESTYGSGSRFQVYFPQIVIEETPLGNMQENSHQNSHQDEDKNEIGKCESEAFFLAPEAHILIVDDNAVNRTVIKKLLDRTKMKIDTAESGAECLRFIQQEGRQYDLILLDHMMPQMDGIETLHRIRDIRHAGNQHSAPSQPALTIPVIALTANAISGARQKYLEAGFSDYITKPISGQDLERILMHYLPAEKISYINESLQNASMSANQPEQKNVSHAQDSSHSNNRDLRKHQQEALQQILNYEVALQYSAGTVEDVLENVEIVLEQEQLMIETLHRCYTATEWADYAIQAHALKTILNTIGLEQMADRARQLEHAAKEPTEQNIILIIDLHMNFVADFQNTMSRLREVIDAKFD